MLCSPTCCQHIANHAQPHNGAASTVAARHHVNGNGAALNGGPVGGRDALLRVRSAQPLGGDLEGRVKPDVAQGTMLVAVLVLDEEGNSVAASLSGSAR